MELRTGLDQGRMDGCIEAQVTIWHSDARLGLWPAIP
jgi:hypothetical protein